MTQNEYESIEVKNRLGDIRIRGGDPLERLVSEAFYAGYDAMQTYEGLKGKVSARLQAIKELKDEYEAKQEAK